MKFRCGESHSIFAAAKVGQSQCYLRPLFISRLPLTHRVFLPGKGKAIVQRDCAGCHALKVITSKRATKEQWSTLVDQMVSRGADVPDEEIETVVDYLAKNFGTDQKHPAAHSKSQHRSQSDK